MDGLLDIDGIMEGTLVGLFDGMLEMDGLKDGIDVILGCIDGLDDGASLCGNASAIRKSDAIEVVTLATACTESTVMVDVTVCGI